MPNGTISGQKRSAFYDGHLDPAMRVARNLQRQSLGVPVGRQRQHLDLVPVPTLDYHLLAHAKVAIHRFRQ